MVRNFLSKDAQIIIGVRDCIKSCNPYKKHRFDTELSGLFLTIIKGFLY